MRLKLSETGRAAVEIRYGTRTVKRTLAFTRANATRTVDVTPPRGLKKLTVTVQRPRRRRQPAHRDARWSAAP